MQEYYFANYRVMMDASVAARESARYFAAFTAPMPYTHTFRVRDGEGKDANERRAWALGCPEVWNNGVFTVHDTGEGWAFIITPKAEQTTMHWVHNLALCSRDYRDITVYAAGEESGCGASEAFGGKRLRDVLLFAVNIGIYLNDGLTLHASMVEKDGLGVIFLGPCGIGKSTQAKLWEACLGANCLCDDRLCLRRIDGRWVGFGLPWNVGETLHQDSVPVGALVRLKKAKESRIEPINLLQTMAELLSQPMLPAWDEAAMDTVTAQMAALAQEEPSFRLYCLPDEAAARLTYETILKMASH